MLVEIPNRHTGDVMHCGEYADLRAAVNALVAKRANLSGANLSGANIKFNKFPSINLLSSINLGTLSNELTTELFRRDVFAHPAINAEKLFINWVQDGPCPYVNEDRFWLFELRKECYKPGLPTMKDSDLILAICKNKRWKINGYL